jgi:hypothetical protein
MTRGRPTTARCRRRTARCRETTVRFRERIENSPKTSTEVPSAFEFRKNAITQKGLRSTRPA